MSSSEKPPVHPVSGSSTYRGEGATRDSDAKRSGWAAAASSETTPLTECATTLTSCRSSAAHTSSRSWAYPVSVPWRTGSKSAMRVDPDPA